MADEILDENTEETSTDNPLENNNPLISMEDNETGAIPNGTWANVMRVSMENKNLLAQKGALYVGTGETNDVIDGSGNTQQIAKTAVLNPPKGDGYGLISEVLNEENPIGLKWAPVFSYDLIIRTQVDFEAFYKTLDNNTCTANSVLFVGDGGNLKFTRSDGKGLHLPDTLYQVEGVNNAIIKITNIEDTDGLGILIGYSSLPTDNLHSITNLTVECEGTDIGSCFRYCTHLTNCTSIVTDTNPDPETGVTYGTGFRDCAYLIDCSSTAPNNAFLNCTQLNNCTGTGTGVSTSRGFTKCTYLTNCTGVGVGSGFHQCVYLMSCTGTATDIDGSGSIAYGFYSCQQLTDCVSTAKAETSEKTSFSKSNASAYGFYSCTQLMGCSATAVSNVHVSGYLEGKSEAHGFYQCTQLTNCIGIGTANLSSNGGSTSQQASGFYVCTQLTNCTGTGNGQNAIGYGFWSCSYCNGCKPGAGETSSSTGVWYLGSYIDPDTCQGFSKKSDTLTIRTQADFEAFYKTLDNNTCKANSVLFIGDGGTLKFTRSDGKGLQLPPTLYQVNGINNAIIEIVDFQFEVKVNQAGVWYNDTLQVNDGKYSISNLTVNCTGGGGNINTYGFSNCAQLTNCKSITAGGSAAEVGFLNCDKLVNCESSVGSSTNSYGRGFYTCTQLINCKGSGTGSFAGYGFSNCTQLTNCAGNGVSNTGNNGYSFYTCAYCSSCIKIAKSSPTSGIWGGTNTKRDDDSCEI